MLATLQFASAAYEPTLAAIHAAVARINASTSSRPPAASYGDQDGHPPQPTSALALGLAPAHICAGTGSGRACRRALAGCKSELACDPCAARRGCAGLPSALHRGGRRALRSPRAVACRSPVLTVSGTAGLGPVSPPLLGCSSAPNTAGTGAALARCERHSARRRGRHSTVGTGGPQSNGVRAA
jgi:hypothetical protein